METKINEQCAAMMGWKRIPWDKFAHMPASKSKVHTASSMNGADYAYATGGDLGVSYLGEGEWHPATKRDHAFIVWNSLSEEEQEAVAREMCRDKSGYIVHIAAKAALDPETLCRAIMDVRCPGWEGEKI